MLDDVKTANSANSWVCHLQHFSVAGQRTGFVSLCCPVQPMLRVGLEPGVFTFIDAGTESFLQALSLRIDVLYCAWESP